MNHQPNAAKSCLPWRMMGAISVMATLFCTPAWADGDTTLVPVQADATHFMSLAPVRAGLTHVKQASLAPVGHSANQVSADAVAPSTHPGFLPLNRDGLVSLHRVSAPSAPSMSAISSTLAATSKPVASNTPPGMNAKATSPTLELFGMDKAPNTNFYQALKGKQ